MMVIQQMGDAYANQTNGAQKLELSTEDESISFNHFVAAKYELIEHLAWQIHPKGQLISE
jgi:hypothetical protein